VATHSMGLWGACGGTSGRPPYGIGEMAAFARARKRGRSAFSRNRLSDEIRAVLTLFHQKERGQRASVIRLEGPVLRVLVSHRCLTYSVRGGAAGTRAVPGQQEAPAETGDLLVTVAHFSDVAVSSSGPEMRLRWG